MNAAANSLSVTGTLKNRLVGPSTSVVIETVSGVVFVATSDLVIGSATVTNTNVNTATNSGATINIIIETLAGVTFVDGVEVVIGDAPGTTVLLSNVNTASKSKSAATVPLGNINTVTNTGTSSSIVVETVEGVTFTNDVNNVMIGSTPVAHGNLNTASNSKNSITISHANINTAIETMTNKGTLKTALNGATTSVVVVTEAGVPMVPTADLFVGSTTIPFANINSASESISNINTSKVTLGNDYNTTVVHLDQAIFQSAIGFEMKFTLTEPQRALAITKSGTKGGDEIPIVLNVEKGFVIDYGANEIEAITNVNIFETPDTDPPILTNATLDLGTGALVIKADETLDLTPITAGMWFYYYCIFIFVYI